MKTKLLKLEEVKVDNELYPRIHPDWITTARYFNALKAGAKFPPICVAKLGKEFILVDGLHRIKAFKANKEKYISAELLTGLDKKQIYVEAVKRNMGHGRQFSTQEVTGIIITLGQWKLSEKQISQIVRLPAKSLKPFVAKRMTRITETHEEIPLKAPLRNLAETEVLSEPNQDRVSGTSQVQMFDNIITMFENGWVDTSDKLVVSRMKKLKKLLDTLTL